MRCRASRRVQRIEHVDPDRRERCDQFGEPRLGRLESVLALPEGVVGVERDDVEVVDASVAAGLMWRGYVADADGL